MRESSSDTVVVLVKGEIPQTLPNPFDLAECDKPIIVNAKDVLRLLTSGDKNFTPAFHSHIFQIAIALNSDILLSEAEKEVQKGYVGLTVSELKTVYKKGPVCVSMMEGMCMKLGSEYDPTCINVSVASNGKIDRILGFF
jgi:hypothetical protein